MEFENLKDLFKSELICLVSKTGFGDLQGECVKLFLDETGKGVSIKKAGSFDRKFEAYHMAEAKTDADYQILKTTTAFPYFCKALQINKNDAIFSIINVPEINEDNFLTLQIGIEEKYTDIRRNFESNYILNITGNEYFIMGKNVHSLNNDKTFILLNSERKYYTVKTKRKGEVVSCNDETSDDPILVISNEEKELRNIDDYRLIICKNIIEFQKADYIAKQSAEALAFVKNGLDKYIAIWNLFAQKEYDYAKKIAGRAGSLYYKKIHKLENNEYVFEISNQENGENFIRELDKIDKESRRVATKKEITTSRGTRIKNYIFSISSISELSSGKLKARLEGGDENKLEYSSGSLEVSIAGNEMQYERRISALERIKSGKSAKPGLIRLLNGEKVASPKRNKVAPVSQTIIDRFGGNRPNTKQELAIETALNTPDFAIIQGPPGTGKTKVIEAIRVRMSEESEDKKLSFGKVLLSAYQRDATRAMGKARDVYGLPIAIYADDTTGKTEEIDDWIDEEAEKIINNHSDLYEKWSDNRLSKSIEKIEVSFKEDSFLLENAETIFLEIKECVEKISDEALNLEFAKVESLIAKANEKRTSITAHTLRSQIKNLPTSQVSYEDCGAEIVRKLGVAVKVELSESNEEAVTIFEKIQSQYQESTIDFSTIKKLKNRLLKSLNPASNLLPSKEVNAAIARLIELAKSTIAKHELGDYESIIAKYIEAFKETPERVRQSLKDFQTVIGATHQKAVGVDIKNIKEQNSNELEYENVIIDEAARSCPPDLLIPMSCAKDRIILVGDHKQLPQFINRDIVNTITQEELDDVDVLNESVFEHLIEIAKKLESIDGITRFVSLDTQYRMPKLLGDFTSKQFYEEDGVIISTPTSPGYDEKFRHDLPGIENKCAIWMDVPNTSSDSRESRKSNGGYSRKAEADRIAKHLQRMFDSGKATELTFGIISFYLEQVKEIKRALVDIGILNNNYELSSEYHDKVKSITVETVDKMQGLEFDIVYLSMTRSTKLFEKKSKNGVKNRFGFLDDQHRICVALTRQKRCLIVCGDKEMLKDKDAEEKIPSLVRFYELCKGGERQVAVI